MSSKGAGCTTEKPLCLHLQHLDNMHSCIVSCSSHHCFEIIDELLLVALEGLLLGTGDDLARARALGLDCRQAPREDGLANERD